LPTENEEDEEEEVTLAEFKRVLVRVEPAETEPGGKWNP
jgi:hypothetical protein